MRILHITGTLSEGGLETFLITLLPSLKQQIPGSTIDVLVLDKNKDSMADEFERSGIHVIHGKYASVRNPLNLFFLYKYIRRYDFIHAHLFPAQYFVALISLLCRKKRIFVTTEHSAWNRRREKPWLFRPVEKLVYRCYDAITAVSKAAKIALDTWAGTGRRSLVVYNGIPLRRFINATGYTKKEIGLKSEDVAVIMVARFFSQKDHLTPVRAIALLPEKYHLFYVGSGDTARCREEVNRCSVGHRVHFLGRRADIPRLAKASDIGVLASFYEGFGLSTVEIMAAGRPVIVSDIDGIREVVEGAGLLFENGNERDLAEKIRYLTEHPAVYEEVACRCEQRSVDFNIDTTVKEYTTLYTNLINGRGIK